MILNRLFSNKLTRFLFTIITLTIVSLALVLLVINLVENQNKIYLLGEGFLDFLNIVKVIKWALLGSLLLFWDKCIDEYSIRNSLSETATYKLKKLKPYAFLAVLIIEAMSFVF